MLRRSPAVMAASLLVAACTPTATPSAPASGRPAPSATLGASASIAPSQPTPEPTPEPTPDRASVPVYAAGSMIETFAPGLRVRSRPGVDQRVVAGLLPEGADLLVLLGPVWVDDFGWYLVRDSDAADPEFAEGWVAAGFEPDPFLAPTVFDLSFNPVVAGFAHETDGEFGPVRIPDENHAIRWLAAPFSRDGCTFRVDLQPAQGEPVPAIRATIGAVAAPGVLDPGYFGDHPELTGDLFVTVTSDCSWALTFIRFQG